MVDVRGVREDRRRPRRSGAKGADHGAAVPRRLLLLQALPAILFTVVFGLFFVDKNREARSVLSSTPGIAAVAAIVAAYVVIALVLRRSRRLAPVAPLVMSAVIIGLAAWIVRPYYVDETANRRLVAGPVADAVQSAAPAPGPATEGAAAPAPAVRVSTGAIAGIGHDGTGTASIIANSDGSRVLRFENLDIENTPDPRVYVVEGNDVRAPGGFELGRLDGNRAKVLDYALPSTEPGPGWTVLVWCRSFSVPIANATQTADGNSS